MIKNALNNEKTYMHGGGHQIRDWIFVEDHCEAIWEIEKQNLINDKFNIGGNCELQNIFVTRKILDLLGKSHELIGISKKDEIFPAPYFRPGQDSRYGTDFTKLKNQTGWNPKTDFDLGLEKTIDWYLNKENS